MRFRPSGGIGPVSKKDDKEANQARAEVVGGEQSTERLFEQRHKHEIERSENIAAGLPPGGAPPEPETVTASSVAAVAPVKIEEEPPFKPVPLAEQPNKPLMDRISDGVTNLVKKVKNLKGGINAWAKEVDQNLPLY